MWKPLGGFISVASMDKRAKPTEADKEAAARLKAIWKNLPAGTRPTQQQLAERMAEQWGRGSQSLISQYMNGSIPLNLKAVLFFAKQLGVEPTEIRDDLPELREHIAASSSLEERIAKLSPHDREVLETVLRRLESGPTLDDTSRFRLARDVNSSRDREHHKKKPK